MKRSWGTVLVLPALVCALVQLATPALGAPLVIGDTECGDLRKTLQAGKVVWKISNCAKLEALVKPVSASCGNGVVDAGEVCDTGDPFNCNGTGSCAACLSCGGPVVTPTPAPTATPPPGSADCAQGELPPLNRAGFENWWGRDGVQIEDNQTHTYCFTVNRDTNRVAFDVGDRTSSAQCFQHVAEYIPPAGSGWATETERGRDTSYVFFRSVGFIPRGVWRIRITAADTPNCADKYQVVAHY